MLKPSSEDISDIYAELGIDKNKLGCVMLKLDVPDDMKALKKELELSDSLYVSQDPAFWWIKGFIADQKPHVSLQYGLIGDTHDDANWNRYAKRVLEGWELPGVRIDHVGFFEPSHEGADYWCIVAHVAVTPELEEGRRRLQLLPHISTFPGFKAHVTIAYVKQSIGEAERNELVTRLNGMLAGRDWKVERIDYGEK